MMLLAFPIFNEEKNLSRLFESLHAQTDSRFNVVFIDNGSTDRSLEMCKCYCGGRQGYSVTTCSTKGSYSCKNMALEMQYEYIVILDADIALKANFVEAYKFAFQFYDIVLCRWNYIGPTRYSYYNGMPFTIDKYCPGFKKSIIERAGRFNAKELSGSDWDFFERAEKYGGIGIASTEVDHYHSHTHIGMYRKCLKYGSGGKPWWALEFISTTLIFVGKLCKQPLFPSKEQFLFDLNEYVKHCFVYLGNLLKPFLRIR